MRETSCTNFINKLIFVVLVLLVCCTEEKLTRIKNISNHSVKLVSYVASEYCALHVNINLCNVSPIVVRKINFSFTACIFYILVYSFFFDFSICILWCTIWSSHLHYFIIMHTYSKRVKMLINVKTGLHNLNCTSWTFYENSYCY